MSDTTSTPDPAQIDPAEIATIAVFHSKSGRDYGISRSNCEDIANEVLRALRRSGWRIVRAEDADTFDPPADYVWTRDSGDPRDWDRSGVFYGDEDMPEGCVPLYRITEEWTAGE